MTKLLCENKGYTLLEVVVATMIMALMAIPLTQGFRMGLSTWEGLHTQITEGERKVLVRQRIATWLENAYALDVNRQPGTPLYPMVGTARSAEFSTALHPDPQKNSMSRVELRLNDRKTLQIGVKPDIYAGNSEVEFRWQDLYSEVANITFSYMEGVTLDGSPIWLDQWQHRSGLPIAVRLKVEFEDEAQNWSPIIAVQKIDEWAFCVLDPVGRYCRTGEIPS